MRFRWAQVVAAAVGCILVAGACTPVRTKSSSRSQASAGKSGSGGAGGAAAGSGGTSGKAAEPEGTNTSGPRSGGAGERPSSGASSGSKNSGTENSTGTKAGSGGSQAGSSPAAGSGGEAGRAAPLEAVRGVLLDALRRPLANVALRVGDQSVTTDGLGKFAVEKVGATYDVSFKLNTTVDETATTYAWRFEGLSRRDPTLVVYPAAEMHQTNLVWHTKGATFPFQASERMLAGFGSPDGDFTVGVNTADYDSPLVYWTGTQTTVGVTHGLMFTVSGDDELPLEYLAHDAKPLTLVVGTDAEATFDFANTKPQSGAIAGRVTGKGQGDRRNVLVLRWTDGTSFVLGADESATEAFSYKVPTIANASAALIGMQGRWDQYPRSVAFADNLSAGQTGITLEVPASASLSAPGDGSMRADATTAFQWAGDAKVFVLAAHAKKGYDAMFVVTGAKETKLPIGEATAYTPPAGAEFSWSVETHGPYASVDEAADDEGLISAYFDGRLHGPRRGAGTFTVSEQRTVVTSP